MQDYVDGSGLLFIKFDGTTGCPQIKLAFLMEILSL